MPPKNRFTREEIIQTAISIVRESGMDALTARSLADRLNSSVKPIFGLFENMEELKKCVLEKSYHMYRAYLDEDMNKGEYPPYKASGMAYIRFAMEEKELFRLLFMRDRKSDEDKGVNSEEMEMLLPLIMKSANVSKENAKRMHCELWLFVHGVAVMYATDYLEMDLKDVSNMCTDVYQGLKARFSRREETE
ncbi:MAG: TetR/AcrR family transcriptional regulator [Clostridia bacterium]|nr:TetR/AcrR family transcriptional regulator [Clostridia bacterium]MBQ4156732.1 TetR/AcrR family transcriptional regulator [Clostridia bacterium]